ncbi:hypothetical protein BJV82DRAFT_589652 [Fennellomyces sp. T-0311]|nr:hypothetical protein BJV82DRAFT_589652 [Fennellomyces sp. T-0311]
MHVPTRICSIQVLLLDTVHSASSALGLVSCQGLGVPHELELHRMAKPVKFGLLRCSINALYPSLNHLFRAHTITIWIFH